MVGEKSIDVVLPASVAGLRLDRALAIALPQHSRERLKALVGGGRVSGSAGVLWDPKLKVKGGEAVTLNVRGSRWLGVVEFENSGPTARHPASHDG